MPTARRTQIAAEQQTNPAWHIHGGRLPNHAGSPISFAMLLNLASVVNADTPDILWGFIRRYYPDANVETQPLLARLVDHAIAYYRTSSARRNATASRTPPSAPPWKTSPPRWPRCRRAANAETIQNAVYEVGKRHPFAELRALVRLPLPGVAWPAGRPALRRLRRAVRHPGDDRTDPRRAQSPG